MADRSRPKRSRQSLAEAAIERLHRFCTLLDTAAHDMGGNVRAARALPNEIRMVIEGGERWTKHEAYLAAQPPGGIDPELLARLRRPMNLGEVIELPGGLRLTAE